MVRLVGQHIPEPVLAMLDGTRPAEQLGKFFLLLTVDPEGRPHVGHLTGGEVLAVEESELRLAVDERSRSRQNIDRTRRATITVVEPDACCYLKGTARVTDATIPPGELLQFTAVCVELTLTEVAFDDQQPLVITTGVRYERSLDRDRELVEWRRIAGALGEAH